MLCFQLRIMTHKIAFHCLQPNSTLNPSGFAVFISRLCIYFYVCRHPAFSLLSTTRSRGLSIARSHAPAQWKATKPPLNVISRKTTTTIGGSRKMASWWRSNSNLTKGNNTHLWLACIYSLRDKREEYGGSRSSTSGSFQVFFCASQYFMDSLRLLPLLKLLLLMLFSFRVMPYDTSSYCHSWLCLLNFLFASSALDGT